MKLALALLRHDLLLALRHGSDTLAVLLFFLLAAALFPLAIGPEPQTLGRLAPGILWVCALLAALLPLERLFAADFEDGTLDQLMLSGLPPAIIALIKATGHWVVTGLPLLVAAGPVALMLRMPEDGIPVLLAGLLPGTMALSLLGTTGAAVAGTAAGDPGADFRRLGGRCGNGRSNCPATHPATVGLACRRFAVVPTCSQRRPTGRRRVAAATCEPRCPGWSARFCRSLVRWPGRHERG